MSDDDNVAVGNRVGWLANDGLVPLVADLLDQSVDALRHVFGAPRFLLVYEYEYDRAHADAIWSRVGPLLGKTDSPPGQPSFQISQVPSYPCSSLILRMAGVVIPS